VLAEAAEKTDGASLTDEELINRVGALNPDQGKGVIEDYLAEKANASHEQTLHDRQRTGSARAPVQDERGRLRGDPDRG